VSRGGTARGTGGGGMLSWELEDCAEDMACMQVGVALLGGEREGGSMGDARGGGG
jgi:hypothetical protein